MTYETVLTALADPTRRQIFESLRREPRSVAVIADSMPVSRPAVSQHLKVLEKAQLVRVKAQGNKRVYGVNISGLAELKSYLDTFWDDALSAYREEVESQLEQSTKAKSKKE